MKKCIFILPYFGKLSNYFQLFLNSCGQNPSFDWLVITDSSQQFNWPPNVHIKRMSFEDFRNHVNLKFGFTPCLDKPYKLCDYKPMYGFLFEDDISDYKYWGHCDCDLIFGSLESLLSPLLEEDYDKLFAAGHLTIYRNTYSNNRMFMSSVDGRSFYREALACEGIYVFDEDFPRNGSGDRCSIHSIFLKNGCRVFQKDLSFNVSTTSDHIRRVAYNAQSRLFELDSNCFTRLYWSKGSLLSFSSDSNGNLIRNEYLYVHLQSRSMRIPSPLIGTPLHNIVEILPDRFRTAHKLPSSVADLRLWSLRCPSTYWLHVYLKKIKRKLTVTMKQLKRLTPPVTLTNHTRNES